MPPVGKGMSVCTEGSLGLVQCFITTLVETNNGSDLSKAETFQTLNSQ